MVGKSIGITENLNNMCGLIIDCALMDSPQLIFPIFVACVVFMVYVLKIGLE